MVEVNPAAASSAAGISAIPDGFIVAAGLIFIDEGGDQLAFDIVDIQAHGSGILDAVADGSFWIEGIGIIGVQRGDNDGNLVIIDISFGNHHKMEMGGLIGINLHIFNGLGDISGG